jgi:A/G-specific adenine glycosylase
MSSQKNNRTFSKAMVIWYHQHGRKTLPWQLDNSPYHTWLSEIMLQQTQVKTVIPYYQTFTERFPNIQTLASASLDEVLHLWTGLGYYSRARNLHKCAQIISEQYQGSFPDKVEELEALPGIGRSTAGAILSLSMEIPAPILDGNVKRVFCRFYCIEGWSGTSAVQKQLWQLAEQLIPKKEVKAYNQSLMDLGANVCKRSKPLCEICPLAPQCQAYKNHSQALFPQPKPKKKLPQKHCHMLILQKENGSVYLEQRPQQGLWGGLWSLPEFNDLNQLQNHCQAFGWKSSSQKELDTIKHTFSHFQLFINPVLCHISNEPDRISEKAGIWYTANEHQVGLASPVKKLIQQVQA